MLCGLGHMYMCMNRDTSMYLSEHGHVLLVGRWTEREEGKGRRPKRTVWAPLLVQASHTVHTSTQNTIPLNMYIMIHTHLEQKSIIELN